MTRISRQFESLQMSSRPIVATVLKNQRLEDIFSYFLPCSERLNSISNNWPLEIRNRSTVAPRETQSISARRPRTTPHNFVPRGLAPNPPKPRKFGKPAIFSTPPEANTRRSKTQLSVCTEVGQNQYPLAHTERWKRRTAIHRFNRGEPTARQRRRVYFRHRGLAARCFSRSAGRAFQAGRSRLDSSAW